MPTRSAWSIRQSPVPVPRLDPHHRAFYALLRSQDVDVLDLTERFLADRFHGEGPLYCRRDTHWSGVGCVVAAQEIAAEVRERPWFASLETRTYRYGWQSTTIAGNLDRERGAAPSGEELRLRAIAAGGAGRPAPVPPAPDSPVLLLGDTHALVFHAGEETYAVGAGLADQLAFEARPAARRRGPRHPRRRARRARPARPTGPRHTGPASGS